MSKFIEVTEREYGHKVFLCITGLKVFNYDNGVTLQDEIEHGPYNRLQVAESYEEIKTMILCDNENINLDIFHERDMQRAKAEKYWKALKELSQADDFFTADFAREALKDD